MPKTPALIPMKARIAEIQSVYESAADRIIAILSGLDPASFTAADSGRALAGVREAVEVLNLQVRSWAPTAIAAAYDEAKGVARTRLELIGAKKSKRYNQARHGRKIAALTKTVLRDFWKANRTIEKTARMYLVSLGQAAAAVAKVQAQVQMFDSAEVADFLKRTLAAALKAKSKYNLGTAHLTSKDIAAKIRAKLLDQIGGGSFIRINGRDYNLKSYSELVARTRMRESQTQAALELAAEFSNDLAEIPRHDNPCEEICAEYQGKVYSISGKHPDYPMLPDGGPPFHCRCECTLNLTSENALAWRGR